MTKLVLSTSLTVLAFIAPVHLGPAIIVALLCGAAVTAGIFRRLIRPTIAVTSSLAIALVVIHGLFYPENRTPLVMVGPVTVWKEGLLYALLVILRILVLVLAFFIAIFTTHPKKMMIALNQKRLSPKLTYVFMVTLQFVPDMQRRATAILDAQQARGLDVKASLWKRFRAFLAVLGPLIGSALISTETRALALEGRGFSRVGQRTYLDDVPDPRGERVLRWAAVGLVCATLTWTLLG